MSAPKICLPNWCNGCRPTVRLAHWNEHVLVRWVPGERMYHGEKKRFPSEVPFTAIDANYFASVGLQPAAGRGFTTDDSARAPRVAIVSVVLMAG